VDTARPRDAQVTRGSQAGGPVRGAVRTGAGFTFCSAFRGRVAARERPEIEMSFHSRNRQQDRIAARAERALAGPAPERADIPPPAPEGGGGPDLMLACYLDSLGLVERMHRLLLDVIKDEFERLGILNVNAVQALLLFNIADHEVTAGELKTRGYYQGSNVSYNLKKLVELGFIHHARCEIDRRSVRIRLTEQGQRVRDVVADLFQRHAAALAPRGVSELDELDRTNTALRRMERFWTEQIRYIY